MRSLSRFLPVLASAAFLGPVRAAEPGETVSEGVLVLRQCPYSFPVCFLVADPGFTSYRILEDSACLPLLGRRVRVAGRLSLGGCDPTDPASGIGMIPHSIEEIPPLSMCGDVNHDGAVTIIDAFILFEHLFDAGAPSPFPSLSDVNGDGKQDLADPVYLLDYLYRDGPRPACGGQ